MCLVRDITERKQAADELRQRERKSSDSPRSTSSASLSGTPGQIPDASDDSPHRAMRSARSRWEVALPGSRPAARHGASTAIPRYPPAIPRLELADCRARWRYIRYVSVSGLTVLIYKTRRLIGYRGVGRAHHRQSGKRTEEALRRSEAYLAEAQRLSHTGTFVFNATGPVYWSEESYRIWELDPLQGLPDLETVLQRIHPDDRERVQRRRPLRRCAKKESTQSSSESFFLTGQSNISNPPAILCSPRMENRRDDRYAHRCDGTQTCASASTRDFASWSRISRT